MSEEKTQLLWAYERSLCPTATNAERKEAFDILENFKQGIDKCLSVGSVLITSKALQERLIGFELLQNFIRRSWSSKDVNLNVLKSKFKEEILVYLSSEICVTPDEEVSIRNALSKMFVFLILYEFPQNWPEVWPNLIQIYSCSNLHKLFVLSIFQRVAEELINSPLSIVPAHRTKDIRQYLTRDSNLKPLFVIFHSELKTEVDQANSGANVLETTKLTNYVLQCLSQYISWCPLDLLDGTFFREYLLVLMTRHQLRMNAVDCLTALLHRKPSSVEERSYLLSLFKMSSLNYIKSTAVESIQSPLNDDNYIFIKKIVQLYVIMNDVYLNVQSKFVNEINSISEQEFSFFFENVLSLQLVPSHYVSQDVLSIVTITLKNVHKNPNKKSLSAFIEPMYNLVLFALMKKGFPSKTDDESCEFAKIDFDDDFEFGTMMAHLRSSGCEVMRLLCDYDLQVTYQLLINDFSKSLKNWAHSSSTRSELAVINHQIHIESKSSAFTSFLQRLNLSETSQLILDIKSQLHEVFLFCMETCSKETNLVVLNSLLSVISALFCFWFETVDTFVRVIKLIFNCLYIEGEHSYAVHRHASSLLLGKVTEHSELFVPFYNDFFPILSQCFVDVQVDKGCRVGILESLVILTCYIDESSRNDNLRLLLQVPVCLLQKKISESCDDVSSFVSFLNLQNFSEWFTNWHSMTELKFTISCINGFLRRLFQTISKDSEKISIPEQAHLCCFGIEAVKLCAPFIIVVLKRLHELHNPEVKSQFCPELDTALEICENERRNLLGIQLSLNEVTENYEKTPVEKLQNYIKELHSNCIQALCSCILLSATEIELNPQNVNNFVDAFFHNYKNLSNVFVGNIIRFFLGSLKDKCPEKYHKTILLPFMRESLVVIFPKLSRDWSLFSLNWAALRDSSVGLNDQGTEKELDEEVLEDLFLRRNTRALLTVIATCMIVEVADREEQCATRTSTTNEGSNRRREEMDEDDADATTTMKKGSAANDLKQFAHLVFQDDVLYETLLLILVNAFVWPDTPSSTKAVMIFWPIFQPTINKQLSNEVVSLMFTQLLKGYQVNEYNTSSSALLLGLILKFYITLRPKYSLLKDILMQVPEINTNVLKDFDEKVFSNYAVGSQGNQLMTTVDKKMKDSLRSILKGVVGRPISCMYNDSMFVDKLPSLPPKKEPNNHFQDNKQPIEDNHFALLF